MDPKSKLKDTRQYKTRRELTASILTLYEYANAQDDTSNTALHYAAEDSHQKFASNLLKYTFLVNTQLCNAEGETAVDLAAVGLAYGLWKSCDKPKQKF